MLEAKTTHRQHAIVEQVIADLKSGPLGHLPGEVRRRLRLHLPRDWPWETPWTQLITRVTDPPTAATP